MIENNKKIENLISGDLMEFPEEFNKRCSKEEFHKMMTSQNSDVPIEEVDFIDYTHLES